MKGNVWKEQRVGNHFLLSHGFRMLLATHLCLTSPDFEQTPLSIRVDQVRTTMTDYSIIHHLYTLPLEPAVRKTFLAKSPSLFCGQGGAAMSSSRAPSIVFSTTIARVTKWLWSQQVGCQSLTSGWPVLVNMGRLVDGHWLKAQIARRLSGM